MLGLFLIDLYAHEKSVRLSYYLHPYSEVVRITCAKRYSRITVPRHHAGQNTIPSCLHLEISHVSEYKNKHNARRFLLKSLESVALSAEPRARGTQHSLPQIYEMFLNQPNKLTENLPEAVKTPSFPYGIESTSKCKMSAKLNIMFEKHLIWCEEI